MWLVKLAAEPQPKNCAQSKYFDGERYGEAHIALSDAFSFPPPWNSLCSLWLFSASCVLNSEKRDTEATKNHGAAITFPAGGS